MKLKLKSLASSIAAVSIAMISPAQASTYTCNDLYNATSAFDASLAAYDEANINGRQATLQDEWRNCLGRSDPEAGIWCDQEYEDKSLALFEEEQYLLLDIQIKQSEMEMISNQLGSEGIICT
jgi:hypothetical protein